jgi:SagB-type dehydrogenase family enzyme
VRSQKVLICSWPVAEALMAADGDDTSLRTALQDRGVADSEVDSVLAQAQAAGILVSERELTDSETYLEPWAFGPLAAAHMFAYHTDRLADPQDELQELQQRRQLGSELPQLLPEPAANRPTIALPAATRRGLAPLIERRRSRRAFGPRPIALAPLAACLDAAFGVTAELKLEDGRVLPLTGAPSPGGLNTYDAFLLLRTLHGVEEGTYRYLPQTHALERTDGASVPFAPLFGGQAWCESASCAIVLVADLHRQAARYTSPTTVSAVLIEAGARVELLLLQAVEESLSAVMVGMTGVGAFDRQLATDAGLPTTTSMTIPICAVLLGDPPT